MLDVKLSEFLFRAAGAEWTMDAVGLVLQVCPQDTAAEIFEQGLLAIFTKHFSVHTAAQSWCETRSFVPSWRCQDRRRSAARHRHGGVSLWRREPFVACH